MEVSAHELERAVESQHGGRAAFVEFKRVLEEHDGRTVWDGDVAVFELSGHPSATRAYAWSSPVAGSTKRRFFTVLHAPPVDSPLAAVRAAIVAEHRKNQE